MTQRTAGFAQAAGVLPPRLRERAMALSLEEREHTEELRLRLGWPMSAVIQGEEHSLGGPPVEGEQLEQLVELASGASLHTVLDQVRQGYLTLPGGHRVGLCGTAALKEGEIHALRALSAANVRIARQVQGAARPVLGAVCPGGRLADTLILAPPGLGKTTLLRDLIRCVSEGEGCRPLRVSLADERGEVAALYNGRPQLEVGRRTDVMEGCSKAQGLMLLLRAMNPQVLAADEITAPGDVEALLEAAGCGVTLLATAHAAGREDLARRGLYRPLLERGVFRFLVRIRRQGGGRAYDVEELSWNDTADGSGFGGGGGGLPGLSGGGGPAPAGAGAAADVRRAGGAGGGAGAERAAPVPAAGAGGRAEPGGGSGPVPGLSPGAGPAGPGGLPHPVAAAERPPGPAGPGGTGPAPPAGERAGPV